MNDQSDSTLQIKPKAGSSPLAASRVSATIVARGRQDAALLARERTLGGDETSEDKNHFLYVSPEIRQMVREQLRRVIDEQKRR